MTQTPVLPIIRVSAFGLLRVSIFNGIDERTITQWDGALPAQLAMLFIDRGMVTRDDVFEEFWPSLDVKEATNVFHVTKRKITERVRKAGFVVDIEDEQIGITNYLNAFYVLNTSQHPRVIVKTVLNLFELDYDVNRLEKAHEQRDDLSYDEIMAAATLYTGDFLLRYDMPWILKRRAELKEKAAELYAAAAKKVKAKGKSQSALVVARTTSIGHYRAALKLLPGREDFVRDAMTLMIANTDFEDARRVYRQLAQHLQDTLGITPAAHLRELYAQIESQ